MCVMYHNAMITTGIPYRDSLSSLIHLSKIVCIVKCSNCEELNRLPYHDYCSVGTSVWILCDQMLPQIVHGYHFQWMHGIPRGP